MRRWVLIVVLTLLASSLACADLDALANQLWPLQYQPGAVPVAQALLEQYPLDDQTPNVKLTLPVAPQDVYALAVETVGHDLLAKQKPLDALALCDKFLETFPNAKNYGPQWWFATRVCDLMAEAAAGAQLPADQALARAQTLSKCLAEGMCLWAPNTLLEHMLQLYREGGQPDEGRKFLEGLPYIRPEIVELNNYWKTMVDMYLGAGAPDQAKQAAVMGYRLTPIVAEAAQDEALQRLLRTLVTTEGKAGVIAFLAYLKTGQGASPLTVALSPLPLTAEQQQQQQEAVGGVWARSVDACLLNGQYAKALYAAQAETVNEGPNATTGVTDIARCFKAKDLCCVRANQYLTWVKTGQGTNPVPSF